MVMEMDKPTPPGGLALTVAALALPAGTQRKRELA
jgi:MYXO-CTERM domain-containing protein